MKLTCIECPRGCDMDVTLDGGIVISVSGNFCPKGKSYAVAEITNPLRTITTTIRLNSGEMLPVKTSVGVPKAKVIDIARAISALSAAKPVSVGQIICNDIDGKGTAIVATATIK